MMTLQQVTGFHACFSTLKTTIKQGNKSSSNKLTPPVCSIANYIHVINIRRWRGTYPRVIHTTPGYIVYIGIVRRHTYTSIIHRPGYTALYIRRHYTALYIGQRYTALYIRRHYTYTSEDAKLGREANAKFLHTEILYAFCLQQTLFICVIIAARANINLSRSSLSGITRTTAPPLAREFNHYLYSSLPQIHL